MVYLIICCCLYDQVRLCNELLVYVIMCTCMLLSNKLEWHLLEFCMETVEML